ncbi:MAG TPA: hypothetical protein VGH27_21230 [Streptosporangiaceae bacterium]
MFELARTAAPHITPAAASETNRFIGESAPLEGKPGSTPSRQNDRISNVQSHQLPDGDIAELFDLDLTAMSCSHERPSHEPKGAC